MLDRQYFKEILPAAIARHDHPVIMVTVHDGRQLYLRTIDRITDGYVCVRALEKVVGTFAPPIGSERHELDVTLPFGSIGDVTVSSASGMPEIAYLITAVSGLADPQSGVCCHGV